MATINDLITDLRYELCDEKNTNFSNELMLSVIKKAVRRANRAIQNHGLAFGKKKATLTTVEDQDYVSLPDDFDVPVGKKCLYRQASGKPIVMCTDDEWSRIVSAPALQYFYFDMESDRIYFKGTPGEAESLILWYFPKIDTSSYTPATEMPWADRVNDIIMEYCSMRLRNIDEMDIAVENSLLADLESGILRAYLHIDPNIADGSGWIG